MADIPGPIGGLPFQWFWNSFRRPFTNIEMNRTTLLLLLICWTTTTMAQRTISLPEGQESPKASLEDVSWIAGHWQGEAFGGITEEVWTPPLGDSMMGSFKMVDEEKVQFYELMVIREVDGTLLFQLKHFNGDMTGWEEKAETVDFALVKVESNKVYFDDFTFEKVDENTLRIDLVTDSNNGEQMEMTFHYARKM